MYTKDGIRSAEDVMLRVIWTERNGVCAGRTANDFNAWEDNMYNHYRNNSNLWRTVRSALEAVLSAAAGEPSDPNRLMHDDQWRDLG